MYRGAEKRTISLKTLPDDGTDGGGKRIPDSGRPGGTERERERGAIDGSRRIEDRTFGFCVRHQGG